MNTIRLLEAHVFVDEGQVIAFDIQDARTSFNLTDHPVLRVRVHATAASSVAAALRKLAVQLIENAETEVEGVPV